MAEFINKADISDVLIERPITFSVKGANYSVFPPTLGKIHLISRLVEAMGLGEGIDGQAMRVLSSTLIAAKKHRETAIRLIAYSTLPGADCLDENKVSARISALHPLDDQDVATLLVTILSMDKTDAVMKQFGIDKESERLARVMKAKQAGNNTLSFAGKSLWGTLIDNACERYGWTYQYVIWGISYSNLQLLLADHVKTVFLTDEERKRLHISTDNVVIRVEDGDTLNNFIKNQSWR